mmetsp:Transcript_6827/g.16756  ORF Transcript_6827/g.16756 Transcript_6827/m.16756 type:complete len:518 (+) Transcript_6827:248-1801(+)
MESRKRLASGMATIVLPVMAIGALLLLSPTLSTQRQEPSSLPSPLASPTSAALRGTTTTTFPHPGRVLGPPPVARMPARPVCSRRSGGSRTYGPGPLRGAFRGAGAVAALAKGAAAAAADDEIKAAQELLEWISENFGDGNGHPAKVEVKAPEGRPRGLFAKQAFKAGDVVLRVPLRLALFESESRYLVEGAGAGIVDDEIDTGGYFSGPEAGYLPRERSEISAAPENYWTARLGLELLDALYQTQKTDHAESPHWEMWKRSLPQRIDLPSTSLSDDDVYFTENYEFIKENALLRRINHRVCEALRFPSNEATSTRDRKISYPYTGEENHNKGGVQWAMNVVSSRSFEDADAGHYIVPGVDMCNHAYGEDANAQVEAEVSAALHNPRMGAVRLVADRDIERGEEIRFTYSRVPNEVLFSYYGFVPEFNPYDDVVLFDGLHEVFEWCGRGNIAPSALDGLVLKFLQAVNDPTQSGGANGRGSDPDDPRPLEDTSQDAMRKNAIVERLEVIRISWNHPQ